MPIVLACTISVASLVTVNYLYNDVDKVNNLCKNTLNGVKHELDELGGTLNKFYNKTARSIQRLDSSREQIKDYDKLLKCELNHKLKINCTDQTVIDDIEGELFLCKHAQIRAARGDYLKLANIDKKMVDLWKHMDDSKAVMDNSNSVDNFFEVASLCTLPTAFFTTVSISLLYTIYRLWEPSYALPWSVLSWSMYRTSFFLNIRTWFSKKSDYVYEQMHKIESCKKTFTERAKYLDEVNDEAKVYLKHIGK